MRRPAPRAALLLAASGYLLFVIYGSLVPLHFRPMAMEDALAEFRAMPYLQLGIASRADWVANLLLFIPLAYLWCGALAPRSHSRGKDLLVCLLVVSACVGLSLAIEFTQLFFPPRTVSINDVLAEGLGAVAAVLLWWITWPRCQAWLQSLPLVQGTSSVSQRLLTVYLVVMLGYSLLPLDLSLSPVELYRKWDEGRILLLPFSAQAESRAHQIYGLASDVAVWIPVAALARLASRQTGRVLFIYVLLAAATLEFLQLFVYSRVSDVTDILTAALGGALGLLLAHRRPGTLAEQRGSARRPGAALWLWWAAFGIWLGVLAMVFWYPFDFNVERGFVRDRLKELWRVPFKAYYYGSEFRAITEVMHKTGFMLPLGILLGQASQALGRGRPHALHHGLAIGTLLAVASCIEGGQLLLPGKNADLTDGLLEVAGGLAGYWGCLAVMARLGPAARGAPR